MVVCSRLPPVCAALTLYIVIDFHVGNIALGIPAINSWTVDKLYGELGGTLEDTDSV
jgi:hypothetical protein